MKIRERKKERKRKKEREKNTERKRQKERKREKDRERDSKRERKKEKEREKKRKGERLKLFLNLICMCNNVVYTTVMDFMFYNFLDQLLKILSFLDAVIIRFK